MKVYVRHFDRQMRNFTESTIENYGGYAEAWADLGIEEPEQVQITKNVILHQNKSDTTGDTAMTPFFDVEGGLHFLKGEFFLVKFENKIALDFELNEQDFRKLKEKFIGLNL